MVRPGRGSECQSENFGLCTLNHGEPLKVFERKNDKNLVLQICFSILILQVRNTSKFVWNFGQ